VGQFALGGLKCSCGLLVTPAFKVPKARVDAVQRGDGALDAALRAAEAAERGAAPDGDDGPGRDGEARADAGAPRRAEKKKPVPMPASKNKGNFSEFR